MSWVLEIFPDKLSQEEEEHLLSETQAKANKENKKKGKEIESNDSTASGSVPIITTVPSAASEKSITTENNIIGKANTADNIENVEHIERCEDLNENESTNRENVKQQYLIENEVIEPTIEATNEEKHTEIDSNEQLVEDDSKEKHGIEIEGNRDESSSATENLTASQETTSSQIVSEASYDNSKNSDVTDFEADDSDEVSERRNRRLCSEREPLPPPPQLEQNRHSQQHQHHFQRPMRGMAHMVNMRGRFPTPNMPFRVPLGEIPKPLNINQMHPPGQQSNIMHRPHQFLAGHTIGVMRPFIRIPMRPGMPLPPENRSPLQRPMQSGSGPIPHQPRLQGPPFPPNRSTFSPFNNNSGVPPSAPNSAGALHIQQQQHQPRSPFMGRPNFIPNSSHPANMNMHGPPRHPQMIPNPNIPPGRMPMQPAIGPPQPPIGRKVLINPNFKGGVQAATSKCIYIKCYE